MKNILEIRLFFLMNMFIIGVESIIYLEIIIFINIQWVFAVHVQLQRNCFQIKQVRVYEICDCNWYVWCR